MTWTDSWKRFAIHLFVGGFAAWLIFKHPLLGVTFWVSFLFYEVVQDWRKKDSGYKDIIGALVLFGIVAGVLAL